MTSADNLAASRDRMLESHLRGRGIQSQPVLDAMAKVPRERFLPSGLKLEAYSDQALPIDCGQTISQPYIVALMTESLELSGGEHVLEIGTGSGYQTAVLATLVRDVVSVERHPALSQQAGQVLSELGFGNVRLRVGDGSRGWPDEAPYDRVVVTAGAGQCPPALLDQLRDGGILVGPFGPDSNQMLQAIYKFCEGTRVKDLSPCRFVPLISDDRQA
jgi:protein-L-isoaspartate(D-aspartate) O-methyltransferase